MKEKLRLIVFSVLLFCVAGCVRWSDTDVAETKRRGDLVRAALADYREKKGAYPERLSELVPAFISSIPQPTVGKSAWDYRMFASERGDYRLAVAVRFRSDPLLEATARRSWVFDTK
jgi:hypothetical protein